MNLSKKWEILAEKMAVAIVEKRDRELLNLFKYNDVQFENLGLPNILFPLVIKVLEKYESEEY